MAIVISIFKHHPTARSALSKLCYKRICEKWSPENTLEEVETWFDDWMNEEIPLAFIALDGNKPIGMCSLQLNDGIRPDLMPWLGDLCVDSQYEKQGIGKLLIEAAKKQAVKQGYKKLYLFAPDPNIPPYYERLGWKIIERDDYHGHPVTVMETEIKPQVLS